MRRPLNKQSRESNDKHLGLNTPNMPGDLMLQLLQNPMYTIEVTPQPQFQAMKSPAPKLAK
jgi:hypothetical protein